MSGTTLFYNTIAIIGSLMLLFAFYRVNSGRWTNKSFWFEFDNVVGAVLIIIYQAHLQAYVSVVLNIVWGGVALFGLVTFFRRAHRHIQRRRRRATAK